MVTISMDELLRWEKKSKDLTAQVKSLETQSKNLEIQNANLRIELEEKTRITNSRQMRVDLSLEGLEERCKALQAILDSTSKQRETLELKVTQSFINIIIIKFRPDNLRIKT